MKDKPLFAPLAWEASHEPCCSLASALGTVGSSPEPRQPSELPSASRGRRAMLLLQQRFARGPGQCPACCHGCCGVPGTGDALSPAGRCRQARGRSSDVSAGLWGNAHPSVLGALVGVTSPSRALRLLCPRSRARLAGGHGARWDHPPHASSAPG